MSKKTASPKKFDSRPTSRRSKALQIIGLIVVISFVLSPLLPDVIRLPQPTPTPIVFPTDTPTASATPTSTTGPLTFPTPGPPPRPTP
ncbi:MAG: hypothetical protein HYZ49_10660 [Chloroflexi bacterium]|nr:hypothetical protein [Chloroflexota bacterium]